MFLEVSLVRIMKTHTPLHGYWLLIGVGIFLAQAAIAQLSLTVLHSFAGGADRQQPQAALVQATNGILYGTTYMGGTNNAGTVFKANPDGSD